MLKVMTPFHCPLGKLKDGRGYQSGSTGTGCDKVGIPQWTIDWVEELGYPLGGYYGEGVSAKIDECIPSRWIFRGCGATPEAKFIGVAMELWMV